MSFLSTIRFDLRYAWRLLWRAPLTSGLAILTLALGVGATTAMFSAVYATLLRPLPYPEPDRLVAATVTSKDLGGDGMVSPIFGLWRAQAARLRGAAAYTTRAALLTGAGDPEPVRSVAATRDLFAVLGVRPALGRTFTAEEDRPGGPLVCVVSHALWRDRFASDPALIGRTISLSDRAYTIVGVLPAGWRFPGATDPDVYVPFALSPPDDVSSPMWFLQAVARLRAGATIDEARAELETIVARAGRGGAGVAPAAARLAQGARVRMDTLQRALVGDVRRVLLVLFGAVACVLLIACANLANLQLARAAGRAREVGVRAALGAGRLRLIAQLLTESALIAGIGAALALPVAGAGIVILRTTPALDIPRAVDLSLDTGLLLFALALAFVSATAAGLAPAIALARGSLDASLRGSTARAGESRGTTRAKALLLVAEIAAACALLVGAGLLTHSLWRLTSTSPGFAAPERVQTARVRLRANRYAEASRQQDYFATLLARVRGLPGLRAAGLASALPLEGFSMAVPLDRADRPTPAGRDAPVVPVTAISDGYLQAMGIPLIAGRDFSPRDTAGAPRVAIVNEALAQRFFPGESALGRRLRLAVNDDSDLLDSGSGRAGDAARVLTIVGIAGNVRQIGLVRPPDPAFYRPFAQQPGASAAIVARTSGEVQPAATAAALVTAVRGLDREQPVSDVKTMADRLAAQMAAPRTNARLLGLFALLAVLLAAVGLYGVLAHVAASRTREMGLRLALGARPADVRRLMLRQGLAIGAVGVACGLGIAALGARLLTRFLFGVTPLDPVTLVAVPLFVLAVVFAATYGPARRAASVDPMAALRVE